MKNKLSLKNELNAMNDDEECALTADHVCNKIWDEIKCNLMHLQWQSGLE